jgi:hypothetical protein
MARFRRHRETDGTRAVVSFNNVLAHAAGSEGLGFDTLVLDSRTRSRRSLSARYASQHFVARWRIAIGTRCVDTA